MKKSVAVVGVVLAAAVVYGASSWYVGQRAQDVIETAVAQGNGQLGEVLGAELSTQPVQLSISRYDRGWFSSSVIYSLKLTSPKGELTEYLLGDSLQHGPFPWSALAQGNFSPVLALSQASMIPSAGSQPWFDSLNGQSPLTIKSRIGFREDGESHWKFQPLDYTSADGSKVVFSGGEMTMAFAPGFDSVKTQGRFAKFHATQANEEVFTLDGVTFDKSYAFGNDATDQTVDLRIAADSASYTDDGSDPIRVLQLTVTGQSTKRDGMLDGTARYEAGSVQFADVNFGKITAGFAVNRLNLDALQDLTATYDQILTEQGLSDTDVADLDDKDVLRLREHLFAMLKSQPSLALDPFVWDNGEGQSTLSVKASFKQPDMVYVDATTDELLLQALSTIDTSLSISKSMFAKLYVQGMQGSEDPARAQESARMIFDMYAGVAKRSGLAQYADGVLTSSIQYENQQITVNGTTLSLAEFLQRIALPFM